MARVDEKDAFLLKWAGLTLGVIALLALAIPRVHSLFAPSPSASDAVASEAETRAILAAVLAQMRFYGGPADRDESFDSARILVLVDRSACFAAEYGEGGCMDRSADVLDATSEIPRKFRELLVAANTSPSPLALEGIPKTKVVAYDAIEQIFTRDSPDWTPERWPDFFEAHPETWGWAQISRPVITKDGRQALLFYSYACGGLCGYGNLYYLIRSPAGWKVAVRKQLWIN